MSLDPKTIIMMNIVSALLMSISLFIVSLGYLGQIKGVAKWAIATLIQSIGWFILSVLRGIIPEIFSVVIGNGLLLLSLGLYFNILAQFNNKKVRGILVYLLVGLEAAMLAYFVLVTPDVNIRIGIVSGASALLMFASSYILLSKRDNRSASHLLMATLFIICASIWAIRSVYTIAMDGNSIQLPFGVYPMQNISYLTFFITSVMLTFGFVLMCNDKYISERKKIEDALKKSEEKFSLLAKNATDIISLHDLNFNYIYVSDSVKPTLGYEPGELIGKSGSDFIHPEDYEYVKERYLSMHNRTSVEYTQFRHKKKDGTYCWMESSANFTFDKDNNISGLVVNTRDISERKKVEEELIIARRLAEQLTGAKDRFLSNMSHEIRTPLNGIIGFTNLLLQNDFPLKQKKQLEIIKTSSDILLVLINDILDLAKINDGKMTLVETEFKLSDLVSGILTSFELTANEKEIKVFSHIDANIPEILIGDTIRVSQILINLINNSIKFTNKGGQIDVSINLQEQDAEKSLLEFSIIDNGIGIPKEKLDIIFEPFIQGNNGTALKYEGTGLGLSIVRRLVTLMNGTIFIERNLKEGTIVNVIIPFKKTATIEITKEKEADLLPDDFKQLGNLNILLAEDNEINQLLAQTILHKFGFEVDTAETGKAAIDFLTKNKYDIILMDLKMPEMGGFEATQYIRTQMPAQKSKIPIIAITADVTLADIEQYKKIGFDDYVIKPFNQMDLYNKIIHLVKKNKI